MFLTIQGKNKIVALTCSNLKTVPKGQNYQAFHAQKFYDIFECKILKQRVEKFVKTVILPVVSSLSMSKVQSIFTNFRYLLSNNVFRNANIHFFMSLCFLELFEIFISRR